MLIGWTLFVFAIFRCLPNLGFREFGDCFTTSRHISYTYGCGIHLWATYTAVPTTGNAHAAGGGGGSGGVGLWFTAVGFVSGRPHSLPNHVSVLEADLAGMIDYDSGTLPSISSRPRLLPPVSTNAIAPVAYIAHLLFFFPLFFRCFVLNFCY